MASWIGGVRGDARCLIYTLCNLNSQPHPHTLPTPVLINSLTLPSEIVGPVWGIPHPALAPHEFVALVAEPIDLLYKEVRPHLSIDGSLLVDFLFLSFSRLFFLVC